MSSPTPELRTDPVTGRQVFVAEGRASRPGAFADGRTRTSDGPENCPFCVGHEADTPAATLTLYSDDDPGKWQVRAVPNKYPAAAGEAETFGGGQTAQPAAGVHEVIIESPRHLTSASELTAAELEKVFWMYRQRLAALKENAQIRHGTVFKNVGAEAGASLEHIHSQLIGLPWVPQGIVQELSGGLDQYHRTGACVYCHMLQEEQREGLRMVAENRAFAAFCPFAARFPMETWILPKQHGSHFEILEAENCRQLAEMLHEVVGRIETALDRPAYNYLIHSAPFDSGALVHYHWHIEVLPRVTRLAGLELGTGCFINPISPESAARHLRERTSPFDNRHPGSDPDSGIP